jgi:hypothetical protein
MKELHDPRPLGNAGARGMGCAPVTRGHPGDAAGARRPMSPGVVSASGLGRSQEVGSGILMRVQL